MVETRGGFQALEHQPRLQLIVTYVSIATVVDYLPEIAPQASPSSLNGSCLLETRSYLNEFSRFLRRISIASESSEDCSRSASLSESIFKPAEWLYDLLSTSSYDSSKGGGLGVQRNHRLASLIYICDVVSSYNGSTTKRNAYLAKIQRKLLAAKLNVIPNMRVLYYSTILKDGSVALDNPERAWFVIRMVQIVKRLSHHTGAQLSALLLHYLAMDLEHGHGSMMIDPNMVEREVLGLSG